MTYDAYLFDLDGTLLDTLPDLHALVNEALAREGFPPRTLEEIRSFIGNGALALVWSAVPEGTKQEVVDRTYRNFCNLYEEYGMNLTVEYEGITQILEELRANGKRIGLISNKFDGGVKLCVSKYFAGGQIEVALGESPEVPRKPDPTGVLKAAEILGVNPDQCAYFGDSANDMRVAHAAGMTAVGVTWGFPPLEKLLEGNPDIVINNPKQILSL